MPFKFYKFLLPLLCGIWSNLLYAQTEPESILYFKKYLVNESDSIKKIGLFNDLAWEYSLSNYDSSLTYAQKAIHLSSLLGDDYWKAVSLEMMALLKEISGEVEEAAKLYMQVIALREKIGGKGLESTYNNLGILFKGQENHQKALIYFRKSYAIEVKNENREGIAGSLINMSISLTNLGKTDSTYSLLLQAKTIAEENNLNYITSNAYLGLSNYYIQKEELDSAIHYCKLIINSEQIDNESLVIAYQNLGDIFLRKKDFTQALAYLEDAETRLRTLNNLEYLNRLYASKAKALAALAKYDQAYIYLSKFSASKDSLISIESVTVLNELEKKYETEKKERQIISLQLGATNSKNQRNIFIFAICFVVLGIIFLFVLLKSKAKTNVIISNSLAEKETLLKEIHHRVKNNLQTISSLLSLQSRYISDKHAIEAVNESKNRVKSMALIHQKLYQKDNLTGIEMKDYVKNLVDSLFVSYGVDYKQINFICEITNIRLDVDTAIPIGLILNELVTNALKYAFDNNKGELLIKMLIENNLLKLIVKDNGKGFELTKTNESSGYGMRLIESLSRKLKATISLDNSTGTRYILTIEKFKLV